MPTIKEKSDGPWLFVTTSPTCNRPSKTQRSQVRRRVMREIGFSRRKKLHILKEDKKEQNVPRQIIEPSSDNMNEHEWNSQNAGPLHTSIPSSLEMGLGYPTPLENNARLILSHSTYPSTNSNSKYPSNISYKCSPTSSHHTCASTATNGSRPQSATHQPLTRCWRHTPNIFSIGSEKLARIRTEV